jgi:hypothetical protein
VTDLIQRIVAAIIRQEGMPPEHPNPGNLRGAPWLDHPVIAGGFWRPTTRAQGIAGAAHVVALHVARGESLAQLIASWAPLAENKTAVYISNVKLWARIPDEHAPLFRYLV